MSYSEEPVEIGAARADALRDRRAGSGEELAGSVQSPARIDVLARS
jgi:hypothetical protein